MTRQEQVEFIAELMSKPRGWNGTESAEKLAKEWGCSVRSVRWMAHDAGLLMRGAQSSLVGRIEETLAELDDVKRRALAGKKPNLLIAHRCIDTQLRVLGALAPTAQVGRGGSASQGELAAGGGDDYAKRSPRERVRILEEALAVERSRVGADGGNNEGDGRH